MICTAVLHPHIDPLARLAECPALPRGSRLKWVAVRNRAHMEALAGSHLRHWRGNAPASGMSLWAFLYFNLTTEDRLPALLRRWESLARPLREQRRRPCQLTPEAALSAALDCADADEYLGDMVMDLEDRYRREHGSLPEHEITGRMILRWLVRKGLDE